MNRPAPNAYPESARLLSAARNGDKAAWDALYAQTAPRLLAWATTLTGSRTEAEDLTQETYLAAFLAADSFHQKSQLLTWLCGIAHRKHRDKSRTRKMQPLPLQEETAQNTVSVPFETDALLQLSFQKALAELPENLREAFVLVAQHGFTHKEAAHILQTPEGTIKWRVVRAARLLRVALADFAPPEHSKTAPPPVPVFTAKENSL